MTSETPAGAPAPDLGPAAPTDQADRADQADPSDGSAFQARAPATLRSLASVIFRLLRSRPLRILFVAAAVGLLVVALVHQGPTLRREVREVSAPVILAAFAAGLAGLTCSMVVWRCLLADLGSSLSFGDAWRVFFLGQLGKYIPGSVWPVIGQMELGADRGVPRSRCAVSMVLSAGIMVLTGSLVAAATVPFGARGSVGRFWWVLLLIPILAALLSPSLLNRMLGFALRVLRTATPPPRLSRRGLAVSVAWALAGWLSNGAMTYLLMQRLAGASQAILLVSVGGFALAWVAGYVAVFAPAGAGVREAVMIAILGTQTKTSVALVVALLTRALTVSADALTGALALALVGRRRLRQLLASRAAKASHPL